MSFLAAIVNKARKPKFELQLKIIDLNNVPLVSGSSYVKWHLPSSTAAEHRGRTDRCPILEHKVIWDYSKTITVRLQMDKTNQLLECLINFEVIQDYSISGRPDKISLGFVKLNLAEYVDGEGDDAGEAGGIVRRYLMQESKVNSTLKIGITMKQLDGERNYVAPPLKTASVFGGIAGIMAGDRVDPEDAGDVPSSTYKPRTAEYGDLQDMYRRTLAASWLAQPGELPPDQCVEDIFAGGDGWAHKDGDFQDYLDQNSNSKPRTPRRNHFRTMSTGYDSGSGDEGDFNSDKRSWHSRVPSGGSNTSKFTLQSRKEKMRSGSGPKNGRPGSSMMRKDSSPSDLGSRTPRGVLDDGHGRGRSGMKRADEVDEFEVREDLIAWKLPESVD